MVIIECTAMLKMLEQDDAKVIAEFESSPELATAKDTNDRTFLHWASLQGRAQLVNHFINTLHCDVNAADDSNSTPLILAVLKGNATVVEWLLDKGANINHRNAQGHSPIQYACSKGWADVVTLLLSRGANVNIQDIRGDTPLHRLASMGRVELLKMVLSHTPKPIVDLQNAEGNTAMHIACEDNEINSALLLMDYGASVDIQNKEEKTPFDLAQRGLRHTINERKIGRCP